MTPTLALLRAAAGLSRSEAANLLNVSLNTIEKWEKGKRGYPPEVEDDMAALVLLVQDCAEKLYRSAQEIIKEQDSGPPDEIEIGLCADDYEANSLGFPTASSHRMAVSIAAARLVRDGISVVTPLRGTTQATAAAADRHESR
jgi:transcriptional regulator with XRE-family HTH domain